MLVCVGDGVGVWRGVVRPCPPVRDDIVTPGDLFPEIIKNYLIRLHAARIEVGLYVYVKGILALECQV